MMGPSLNIQITKGREILSWGPVLNQNTDPESALLVEGIDLTASVRASCVCWCRGGG